jgi:hypothetical protein
MIVIFIPSIVRGIPKSKSALVFHSWLVCAEDVFFSFLPVMMSLKRKIFFKKTKFPV